MKPLFAKRSLMAGLCAGLLILGGCSTINELLFGDAETAAQEAFQEKGKYVWMAILARNYVTASDPDRGIVQAVCAVEQTVYDASLGAAAAAQAGGDELLKVLAAMSSGLASFSLEVFGQVVVPDFELVSDRTIVLARVGAQSVAEMRLWRKGFVEAKSADFVQNGRDPTPEEWQQLDAKVEEVHGAVRAACAAPT